MVETRDLDFTKVSALAVEDDAGGMAIIGVMMRYLGMKSYISTTGEGVVELRPASLEPPDQFADGLDTLRQSDLLLGDTGALARAYASCSSTLKIVK